jgi:hypothetical protein
MGLVSTIIPLYCYKLTDVRLGCPILVGRYMGSYYSTLGTISHAYGADEMGGGNGFDEVNHAPTTNNGWKYV